MHFCRDPAHVCPTRAARVDIAQGWATPGRILPKLGRHRLNSGQMCPKSRQSRPTPIELARRRLKSRRFRSRLGRIRPISANFGSRSTGFGLSLTKFRQRLHWNGQTRSERIMHVISESVLVVRVLHACDVCVCERAPDGAFRLHLQRHVAHALYSWTPWCTYATHVPMCQQPARSCSGLHVWP